MYLQDDWISVPIRKGICLNHPLPSNSITYYGHADDIINIIGDISSTGDIDLSFSNDDQYLIHHPDTLVTATAVATSMPCARKPLLQDRLRATSPTTEPLLYGNLLHELFQACLTNSEWSESFRGQCINRLCSKEAIIAAVWELNKPMSDLHSKLLERSASWPIWASTYLSSIPKPGGVLSDPRGKSPDQSGKACVSAIHDIEEDIWSPRLGMKGKVDVSVQARVVGKLALPLEKASAGVVAPFEIKTGRSIGVMEHRAQTMLYTMLMADRYGKSRNCSWLHRRC